tara:strand:+ start:969 stop:1343 length:375 start_codon:yes stop_codon:yes gene_type:complete
VFKAEKKEELQEKLLEDLNNMPRVIRKKLGKNVLGHANDDNTILINKSVKKNSDQEKAILAHEKVHLKQMKKGDLKYNDDYFYWKGKKYSRNKIKEGSENLPWEKEAYKASRRVMHGIRKRRKK